MREVGIINGLSVNLAPLVKNYELSLCCGLKKEISRLKDTLLALDSTLIDAEEKSLRKMDHQTKDWLRKLENVAYEVRDIVDNVNLEDLRLQVKQLAALSSTRKKVTNTITFPFNQFGSCWRNFKIAHKIKEIQEKLDKISLERVRFEIRHTTTQTTSKSSSEEFISLPTESSRRIHGRDGDKEKIVNLLVHPYDDTKRFSVLPIVGHGGIGKTTLAKMVFDDNKVEKYFDLKFWVSMSKEFDINRVINSIITRTAESSWETSLKNVRDKLSGKRFLIILDDLWNEDTEVWEKLRSILDCGSNGTMVLVTTGSKKVAKLMETTEIFEISRLSNDDCWLLFEERAFVDNLQKSPRLIEIGKEIAKKCRGVPLVAKILGSRMRFKDCEEEDWRRIRDSEMWEISQNEEIDVLAILRSSYYDLPYHLRRCFAICAIFPREMLFDRDQLIQLWMAHGLIPLEINQNPENVGLNIWKELCWRSFLQEFKIENSEVSPPCTMHDLMYDVAQSVMKDRCHIMDDDKSSSDGFGVEIHHLTLDVNEIKKTSLALLKKIGGLQSLILNPTNDRKFFSKETANDGNVLSKEIFSALKKFPSLRVLDLCSFDATFSDLRCIGHLKHLRYLKLSDMQITELPESICGLLNLQTLDIDRCCYIQSLPKNMKDLISLRHFYLDGCALKCMPKGLRQLKDLKTLNTFVIGKGKRDCQLEELKELNLCGFLGVKGLGRISDENIASGNGKICFTAENSGLNKLMLSWESDEEEEVDDEKMNRHEEIGKSLQVPTRMLKGLEMCGYEGVNLPDWVGESSSSLTYLKLYGLKNVKHLFPHNNTVFPLLDYVDIVGMTHLRELVSNNCSEALPKLRKLHLFNCPELGSLPRNLKSLTEIDLFGECSDQLLCSISRVEALTDLSLMCVKERRVLLPADDQTSFHNYNITSSSSCFQSLVNLKFNHCEEISYLFDKKIAIQQLPLLQSLVIYSCSKLHCLFEQGSIVQFPLLQRLSIAHCESLVSISHDKGEGRNNVLNLNSLTDLYICCCPELKISREEFRTLNSNSLERLVIVECPMLVPKEEETDNIMSLISSLEKRFG